MNNWISISVQLGGQKCTIGRAKMYNWVGKKEQLDGQKCTIGRKKCTTFFIKSILINNNKTMILHKFIDMHNYVIKIH